MFARRFLSFHSALPPGHNLKFLSPIILALARPSCKSNYSRTYGISGGGGYTGSLVRPIRCASKPFVSPTYARFVRNSFVSPTYAKTGGYIPPKMSARRHFLSLLPIHALPLCTPVPATASAEEGFQSLAHTSEGVRYIGALPPVTDHESPVTNHQSLRLPAYQLRRAPHQLQPATYPLLPTEVTPK